MDIIIIGCGATGVSILNNLHNQFVKLQCNNDFNKNINLHIIDNKKLFSKGIAFGNAREEHLLNTNYNLMNIDLLATNHYQNWLFSKNSNCNKDRKSYSKYIHESYKKLKQITKIKILEYTDYACDVETLEQKIIVKTEKENITGDYLIMSIGSFETNNFPFLQNHVNFYKPKQFNDINFIPKNSRIAILGSSLSAVDIICSIVNKKIKNHIDIYSKSGLLPTCQKLNNNIYKPKHFIYSNIYNLILEGRLTLKTLLELFDKELLHINSEFKTANNLLNDSNLYKYFEYLYQRAKKCNLPLQDILLSSREYSHEIWLMLTNIEKRVFTKYYQSIWNVYRHPIPVENFNLLRKLSKDDKLTINKIKYINNINNKIKITNHQNIYKYYDYVIDGTGSSNNIMSTKNKLINKMLKNKLILKNNFGGIKVNPINLKVINKKTDRIYAVGPIVKGDLYSSNAFWFNNQISNKVITDILSKES